MLSGLVVAAGLGAATALLGSFRPLPRARPGATTPAISIVVPARNEAATIGELLSSVAALDPPAHEVIVVDDGSTDDTAARAAARGATVVVAGEPPPGWLGKPWACHCGSEHAAGSHLLFLDADTTVAPGVLADLHAVHTASGGGLVSVQPFHRVVRPYEDLSAYFNAAAVMGSGMFASRLRRRAAAAYGACLFTSRRDYRRSGGHASVRDDIVEDMALARRYRHVGLPVTCFGGGRSVAFRMYGAGPAQLLEGWSKNIAAGAAGAHPIAVAGTSLWVAAHVLAGRAWICSVLALARRRPPPVAALVAAGATVVHQRRLLARIGSFRRSTAFAFPVPLAAFVATFARSVYLRRWRRRVTWKGRVIALDPAPERPCRW